MKASNDLLALLRIRLPAMTKVLREVGQFVRRHPEKVVSLSINEVADACEVSIASVMRFCKELDYSSFAAFKLALATELASQANSKTEHTQERKGDYAHELAERLCAVIRMTARLVRSADIEQVARAMIAARRVLLFGVGASYAPASFLAYKLTRIGVTNMLFADSHMMAMSVNVSGSEDLLVIFSSSGSIRDSVELARLAKDKALPTVAVTNRAKSPLGEICSRQIVAVGAESPLSSGSLESKCGQLVVVELLFEAICRISRVHAARIKGAADAVSGKLY